MKLGVSPGVLARMELPVDVYGVSREDLGDLRLESGGRQVPYFLHSPPEPSMVWSATGLTPNPGRGRGESEILLPEIPQGVHLTALELRTSASVFRRPVAIHFRGEGSRPGIEAPPRIILKVWSCEGASALPSRLVVPLWGAGPRGRIRVVIQDGDNPPLPTVDAVLWRRRHTVYFFAPGGPVRLLSGSPDLHPPSYDLATLGFQILATPSTTVALGPPVAGASPAGSRTVQLSLLGALILCSAVLLLILARAVKRQAG